MIQLLRALIAAFLGELAAQIAPKKPAPTDGKGRWGDLLDPMLPCGECDLESDECSCLLGKLKAHAFGIDGFNVDQLYRDIEELEHGK